MQRARRGARTEAASRGGQAMQSDEPQPRLVRKVLLKLHAAHSDAMTIAAGKEAFVQAAVNRQLDFESNLRRRCFFG